MSSVPPWCLFYSFGNFWMPLACRLLIVFAAAGPRVVRGGSFYERPRQARSGQRLGYWPWGRYQSVGFRVAMEAE